MPLEPGTHGIVSVEPLRVRDEHSVGEWSCSICGRMHAVSSTWVLTYRPDDGPDLRFILCPQCGEIRRPVSAIVDRERLAEVEGFDDLREHLTRVARLRRDGDLRHVPLRDADLHALAAGRGVDVGALVAELEGRGVLVRSERPEPG